jgi:general secretion pathway protein F
MAAYSYKALTPEGRISRGIIEGESERQVRNLLRARDLKPLEVMAGKSREQAESPAGRQRLDTALLALFTRQLATLTRAGVPLDEAIGATARQQDKAQVKTLLLQLRSKVVAGESLASALAAYPHAFPRLYRATVRAGEQAGLLGEVLEKLAGHIEYRHAMARKLNMAMLYPLVLLAVSTGVIALLMVMVLPELSDLFNRTDTPLPLLTRMLVAGSQFLGAWWWLLLLAVLAAAGGFRQLLRQPAWLHRWHALLLQLPVAGSLLKTADSARFASTLSILVQSGVALVDAIGIATAVMSNVVLQERTAAVATRVEEGGSLSLALEQCGHFPPLMTQLVASGENSGTLDTMLAKAAETQEQQLDLALGSLMKIMEPAVIVVMAVVVGAIVMAVLLPIMQMNTLVP